MNAAYAYSLLFKNRLDCCLLQFFVGFLTQSFTCRITLTFTGEDCKNIYQLALVQISSSLPGKLILGMEMFGVQNI